MHSKTGWEDDCGVMQEDLQVGLMKCWQMADKVSRNLIAEGIIFSNGQMRKKGKAWCMAADGKKDLFYEGGPRFRRVQAV